jgi:hypothetical protein
LLKKSIIITEVINLLVCPKCKKEFQNSKSYCCYCGAELEEKNHYEDSILDVTKKMIELCEKEDLLIVSNTTNDRPRIRPKYDTGWFRMKEEPEKYKQTVKCLTRIAEIIKENYSYLEKNSKGYMNNLMIDVHTNLQNSLQIDFKLRILKKKDDIVNSIWILNFDLPFCDAKALLDLVSEEDKKNIYENINELKKECENTIRKCKGALEIIEKGFQNQSS